MVDKDAETLTTLSYEPIQGKLVEARAKLIERQKILHARGQLDEEGGNIEKMRSRIEDFGKKMIASDDLINSMEELMDLADEIGFDGLQLIERILADKDQGLNEAHATRK